MVVSFTIVAKHAKVKSSPKNNNPNKQDPTTRIHINNKKGNILRTHALSLTRIHITTNNYPRMLRRFSTLMYKFLLYNRVQKVDKYYGFIISHAQKTFKYDHFNLYVAICNFL